jgi:formate hydrogenlyase subunit 6/NADH:ubiquinone oxidoreductase subunit I
VQYKLAIENLSSFIGAVSKGRKLYGIERRNDRLHLAASAQWDPQKNTLGEYRPVEPLKAVVFKPREFLGALSADSAVPEVKEAVVIGVKNCDLSSLKIHDFVFLSDPVDPYYKASRDSTILISCDCTDALDVCFCTAVGEQPYPKTGFDINLSETSQGYIVESGSEKGEKVLKEVEGVLGQAGDAMLREREQKRSELVKKIESQSLGKGLSAGQDYQKAVRKTVESSLWEDFAQDCVECGACNYVCCTCHCFLLADGFSGDKSASRIKQWDSCLNLNFARVAGGANPRRHRAERLYNRFDKKFNFFRTVRGEYACDGCGRCAEACTGKIDIRDVLKKACDEL